MHQALIDSLGPRLYDPHLPEAELAAQVRQTLQETIDAEQTPLSHADRTRIAQEVSDEILGHGPLEPLLRDAEITEIMVNGPDSIYVERAARSTRSTPTSPTRRTCGGSSTRSSAASAGASTRPARWSTPACPTAPACQRGHRARRPGRCRAHHPEVLRGPVHRRRPHRLRHDVAAVRDFLKACVMGRRNIVISGGTGSGKTTTLNVISSFLPEDERIITIEDAAELQLHQDHVLRLESRPANIEGRGPDRHPRPRQERAAHAARPHRRR